MPMLQPKAQLSSRIALKNILITTDFSTASSAALPFALAFSRMFSGRLFAAHVLASEPRLQVITDRLPAQDDQDWRDARQKLLAFTAPDSLGNASCKLILGRGDLDEVIPTVIQENEIDLVVLGTHGRRGIPKLVLGSGAEKIYRSATCPVLTVGPKVPRNAGESWTMRRILLPVDLDEPSDHVLHYALSLAEENESQLVLLHSVPMVPWQQRASVENRTRQELMRLIPSEAHDWCTTESIVRWEHPAEAILRAAEDHEADLIVMGVHQARALASRLPWPIASEVVSRAPCPVLTVRI
jgi:nucleotide-binding universal stress UspA family protein